MSRFEKDVEATINGESMSLRVAYGLDHALGYFADLHGDHPEIGDLSIESEYGKNAVLELFEKYGITKQIPEWHVRSIAMDLPISSSEEEYDNNLKEAVKNWKLKNWEVKK